MRKIQAKTKILIAVILAFCLIVSACFGLFFGLRNRNKSGEITLNTITAVSSQYKTYSKAYNKRNFAFSTNVYQQTTVEDKTFENTILNFSTQIPSREDSKTTINVLEKIDSMGNLSDQIVVNGYIIGEICYDENGYISSNTINYNNIYYDYEDANISSLIINNVKYDYIYNNNYLIETTFEDEPFAKFDYSNYGKISKETYSFFGRLFEHTNVATIESAYNPETNTKIVGKIYDYVNNQPYEITKKKTNIDGAEYEVVAKVVLGEKYAEFQYDYVYNGTPYITHVKTNDDEYSLSYLNDKILTKTRENEITTFVYSSTGQILGMNVGKIVDDEFFEIFITFITDGFGNVIEANYLDVKIENDAVSLSVKKIYEQQFDCFGHKIYQNYYKSGVDTNFGFNSALNFDGVELAYINGNLYSPLVADYIYQVGEDTVNRRMFKTNTQKRIDPTLDTVQKSVAIESLQNEILQRLKTSSISGIKLINNELNVGVADVFTLPISVDPDNMLKSPSKVAFIVNLENHAETKYYKEFAKKYFATGEETFASFDEYYLSSLLSEELNFQFIHNGKLFTVSYVEPGIYGYTVKNTYSSADYIENKNIINYDTGKYVTFYETTLDTDTYVEDISFLTNFSSTEEIDSYFEDLGFINTTIGETFNDVNFGENSNYIANLIKNTCNFNLPAYDSEKQYIKIDDYGNYVVEDIPEGAGVETPTHNPNYDEIKQGFTYLLSAAMFIVNGALMVASCGAWSVVCGFVAIAGGALVGICGVVKIKEGYTGHSWIVDNILKGKSELLDTIASVASISATAATIIGGLTFKSCFVEGTQVCSQNGYIDIENLKVGDYVLSYDETTKTQSFKKVLNTYENQVDTLCQVTIDGKEIVSTLNHPYYVNGQWVEASKLCVGDQVLMSDGTTKKITSVVIVDSPNTKVYNINVDENHNYFAEDVLVHNNCSNIPKNDKLGNYTEKSLKDYVTAASKKVKAEYALRGESTFFKWFKIRREIWKEVANSIRTSGDDVLMKITNFKDVLEKGKAPILKLASGDTARIQLHHVVSKANDMFRVVPMTPQNHTLFHMRYGYRYFQSIARGTPWLLK